MRNMGGLQEVHADHVGADVGRHAGDRRRSALLRLLLEGRDPRLALPARATHSTLADAQLARHPGQRDPVPRLRARARRGVHDRGLHDAHDALHLPRPEPDRREGARASARGAVDHDRSARRARRLQRRSAAGSTCRRCSRVGPIGALEHWLEPVVGEATLRVTGGAPIEASHGTEYALIVVGGRSSRSPVSRSPSRGSSPRRSCPTAQAPAEHGFERVLANKYYVDEVYDAAIVAAGRRRVARPALARRRQRRDRSPHAPARPEQGRRRRRGHRADGRLASRAVGYLGSQLQSGRVGTYAWVLVVGVLFVLGAFTFR